MITQCYEHMRSFFAICVVITTWSCLATMTATEATADPTSQFFSHASADLIVNAQSRTSDSQPSLAVTSSGDCWMAWRGYLYGEEQIFYCPIGASIAEPQKAISQAPGIHDHPRMIVTEEKHLWVFWSSKSNDKWSLMVRRWNDGDWMPEERLSDNGSNAFYPVAVETTKGQLVVAWQDYSHQRFRIVTRVFDGQIWQKSVVVSDEQADSFRPALAVDQQGQTWCCWDTYRAGNYCVFARPIHPSLDEPQRITPDGQNCLKPVALSSRRHGLCVAWLRLADIWGGEGAIDQRHTLHMAVRSNSQWRVVTTSDADDVAAWLTHGLLARMYPKPGGIHGYTGRRRHPMLLEDGDSVWLLWERKMHHDGLSSPLATGQLIGRRLLGQTWDEPVILHSGYVDYHVCEPPLAQNGKTFIVASQLPQRERRIYHRIVLDLNRTASLDQDQWRGWKPVKLPHADSLIDRYQVEIDQKILNVYWADLHCHSGLTADAEGEIDELIHYARDRAKLDIVVMQENDFLYDCPLTESEYALGVFHSNVYSRPGKFLALPGFEWTPRLPSHDHIVPIEQPPWRRSFPNHRTIIYPPPGGPVVRHSENGNDILKLADAVEKAGGIMHTQHQEFKLSGRKCEVNIEVASGWRTFIFQPQFIHRTLNMGPHLGFVATSDSHRRNPGLGGGLTAICAESLTADKIIDALRNRRCWATNGSRIFVDARVNGQFMGEVVHSKPEIKLTLDARGTRPLVSATLVRDGKEVQKFSGNSKSELHVQWADQLEPGRHWYYWIVQQEGSSPQYPSNVKVAFGNYAWSSPHYVYVDR